MTCPKCNASNRLEAAFCSGCGASLAAQQTPAETYYPTMRGYEAPGTPSGAGRYAVDKNPKVALFLACIAPSTGQFYNQDLSKGLVVTTVFWALIFLAGTGVGALIAVPLLLALYIWAINDAYRVAKREKALW